jgi:BirA family biotin operon repressor/biotin-[acetyl-CoA-carboxylase] ligase
MVHLDSTGSTNDSARELALAGAPGGTVVLAEEQSAGRGRQGRAWIAPRGTGLTLSALVRPDEPDRLAEVDLLPLAAALAVCETCEAVTPVRCSIKWPNDVLVHDRKLAGILIESRPQDGWAVVGVGLNLNTTEDELGSELRRTATSLRIEAGGQIDRQLALELLLDRLGAWLVSPAARNADSLLTAYRGRDALRGRPIWWTAGDARLSGEAQGVDERGRLVVFTDSSERIALEAGEVHLYA